MSIHICNGKNNLETNTSETKVQSVPFKIHADCDAEISKYFNPYVKTDDKNTLSASFRGYPLKGKELKLPDGYAGVVLHESIKPVTEKDERKLYVIHTFNTLTYWNWGKTPDQDSALIKALDWIDIAEALHSPINEE